MESLFFNIQNNHYRVTQIDKYNVGNIERVDIQNGLLFFKVNIKNGVWRLNIKDIDRFVMIAVVNQGSLVVNNKILNSGYSATFAVSYYEFSIELKKSKKSDIFILFVADFFLKRYLEDKADNPIDYLYNLLREKESFCSIQKNSLDALSSYIIKQVVEVKNSSCMQRLRGESLILELLIHHLSFLNIPKNSLSSDDLKIVKKANAILQKEFRKPPTIKELAKRCATNDTKLKRVFKEFHNLTINQYIQNLKLEYANILLQDSSLSVKEVVFKVGYKHQGYFSKIFFDKYGITPSALSREINF